MLDTSLLLQRLMILAASPRPHVAVGLAGRRVGRREHGQIVQEPWCKEGTPQMWPGSARGHICRGLWLLQESCGCKESGGPVGWAERDPGKWGGTELVQTQTQVPCTVY